MEPTRLYNRPDAADRLCLSVNALDRLIKTGNLRPVRVGSRVLISDAEIARFIIEAESR